MPTAQIGETCKQAVGTAMGACKWMPLLTENGAAYELDSGSRRCNCIYRRTYHR